MDEGPIGGTPTIINTRVEADCAEREHILRVLNPTVAQREREEVPTFKAFVEKKWFPVYTDAAENRREHDEGEGVSSSRVFDP